MAPKYRTVRDTLMYEYAKLIADAAVGAVATASPQIAAGSATGPSS